MSDNNSTEYRRRAADILPGGVNGPSLADLYKLMVGMQHQLDIVLRKQEEHATAFVTNDLGKPDHDGHRHYHSRKIKFDEAVEGYKVDATKRVVGIVIGVICTLIAVGFMTWVQGGMK